jgi:hypothetical protein
MKDYMVTSEEFLVVLAIVFAKGNLMSSFPRQPLIVDLPSIVKEPGVNT